jgi:hypothetical protein
MLQIVYCGGAKIPSNSAAGGDCIRRDGVQPEKKRHLRRWAAHMRRLAEGEVDTELNLRLLEVAAEYARLADGAAARLAEPADERDVDERN